MGQASPTIARTSCGRTIMLIAKGATYGLSFRSDTSATAGTCAANVVLVLMATTSLPAALGATTALTTRLPSLSTCARRTGGPTARGLVAA